MKQFKKRSRKILLILCCGLLSASMYAQVKITGRVVDNNGDPIPGANVVIKGTTVGAVSDSNGNYTVSAPDAGAVIVFSFMGYESQEMVVGDKTSMDVTLTEATTEIEEVVVVGFGTQKKVNLTGAVKAVSAETFENRPVSNIGQALQGIVPNLNVTINNGAPNEVPNFNIRGGTHVEKDGNGTWTVYQRNPLILVDGVEYDATMLNQMNPNDIESMSVIMDASAAAIYGTKAAYGVMLIQTKSGQYGQKGRISYSYDLSLNRASAIPDILDAYTIQKATMDRNVWRGGSASSADETRLEAIKKWMDDPKPENAWQLVGGRIDWVSSQNPYDLVVRDWAPTQKHNLSFQGGTDNISYYVSLGYQNEEGLYKIGNDEYNRYNAMMRIKAKIKPWFNVEARLNYNRTIYEAPYMVGGKGNLWSAMRNETQRNINMPLMTGPKDPIPNAYTDNILNWISYGARYKNIATTTAISLSPEFIILPGVLRVKADLSYTPRTANDNRRSPKFEYISDSWSSLRSEQEEAQEHRGRIYRSSTDNYLVNAYLDFNKTFFKIHQLSAVLGYNQEYLEFGQTTSNFRGLFSPDIQKPAAADDVSLHRIETNAYVRTTRGVFGRINYVFNDRYLLEVNARYDGSSRFTKDDRFFMFPSFSAGWIISQESFMEFAKPWLSHLKVKGSWGKLGSQPNSNYPYQEVLSSGTVAFLIDGKQLSYVGAPNLTSSALTWQKATTTNFGVEANFLKNRLQTEFNTYRRAVTDILLDGGDVRYPATLGVSVSQMPQINSGRMDAYGWELTLNWRDKLPGGISYKIGAVVSDERTEIVKFTPNAEKNVDSMYEGMVSGEIWGYQTGGILQESDLVRNPSNPNAWIFYGPKPTGATLWPGDIWYIDRNSDGVINTGNNTVENPGDRRIIGNSAPRYRFGITGDVAWKGFDLNFFFQGIGKRDIWTGNSAYWGGGAGSQWMLDHSWTPDRTDAKFPMYGAVPSTQTEYLLNGSYIRLKQLVLGYTLPQGILGRIGVERLRFTISGFNLFDVTSIPDVFDPDQISDAYPQKRTFAFGAQITF
jgi:TonB-linked SusC/RagA family outer membrane protein